MNSQPGDPKSDHLEHRRETMRRELLGQMKAHHRSRLARRRAGSVAILFLMVGLLFMLTAPWQRSLTDRIATNGEGNVPDITTAPVREHHPSIRVQFVTTRTSITDRYVSNPPSIVQLIDDQRLLDDLVALNRPTGLVRSGEKAWLTESVADPSRKP